jgi:antitoxin component of RelBE/YafQ-DinJ toxin-antitoxin module
MEDRTPGMRRKTKTTLINVRVEQTRKARLVAMAGDLGISPSELVRNLLLVAIEQHATKERRH